MARLKKLGRVILASVHAHIGTTNDVYAAAMKQVGDMFGDKWRHLPWRHLPCIIGIDVNEEVAWIEDDNATHGVTTYLGNMNFQASVESLTVHGSSPVPPCEQQRHDATHFPRDPTRSGRQIDMIYTRQVRCDPLQIDAERRRL